MTDSPRGARLPGRMAASIWSRVGSSAASAVTTADDSAGTDETPDRTATPRALALASKLLIPLVKPASSERSRQGMPRSIAASARR